MTLRRRETGCVRRLRCCGVGVLPLQTRSRFRSRLQAKRERLMWWTSQRANAVTGGIWLIGLGVLMATRFWFPGILFLVGITAIVQGSGRRSGWQSVHGGLWLMLLAAWAMMRFSMSVLLVALGVYVIVAALMRPRPFQKPYV